MPGVGSEVPIGRERLAVLAGVAGLDELALQGFDPYAAVAKVEHAVRKGGLRLLAHVPLSSLRNLAPRADRFNRFRRQIRRPFGKTRSSIRFAVSPTVDSQHRLFDIPSCLNRHGGFPEVDGNLFRVLRNGGSLRMIHKVEAQGLSHSFVVFAPRQLGVATPAETIAISRIVVPHSRPVHHPSQ